MATKIFKYRFVRILLGLAAICILAPLALVVLYKFVQPPVTMLMVERRFFADAPRKVSELRHDPVPMEQISRNMVFAAMAGEDQKFLDHDGFDFEAIEKAVKHNETHHKKFGASTISQQTAKNAFLWETRSYVRKGLEFPLTMAIELIWGKRRIMEVYLNEVELGPGVFGVEAASEYWFHEPASRLTPHQAALLAACLPSPRKFKPVNSSAFVANHADWIEEQMGFMDQGQIAAQLDLPRR
jgi:monofunctional biosynthetic peptidoglycan transglycosylase